MQSDGKKRTSLGMLWVAGCETCEELRSSVLSRGEWWEDAGVVEGRVRGTRGTEVAIERLVETPIDGSSTQL